MITRRVAFRPGPNSGHTSLRDVAPVGTRLRKAAATEDGGEARLAPLPFGAAIMLERCEPQGLRARAARPAEGARMFGIHDFALFLGVGILLNLTPGPDTALVLSHSLRQGTGDGAGGGARAGVLAALGVGAGCLVHITAATLGLSALLMASATAFTVLKWAGAAYLAFIGLSMMFGAQEPAVPAAQSKGVTGRSAFLQGFLTNALNPKVALFFLAFLPQFVAAAAPGKALGFALLGATFDLTGTLWLVIVALVAARSARHFAGRSALRRWSQRLIGAVLVALAGKLAAGQAP